MRSFNWDTNLVLWAEEVRGEPYEWGETDCGQLVLDGLDIVYEADPRDSIPSWTTETGAKRALTKMEGVGGFLEILGASRVSQGFHSAGDIFIEHKDGFPSIGILIRDAVLTSTHEKGVHLMTPDEFNADNIFRV